MRYGIGDIDESTRRIVDWHIIKTINIMRETSINCDKTYIKYIDMCVPGYLDQYTEWRLINWCSIYLEHLRSEAIVTYGYIWGCTLVDEGAVADVGDTGECETWEGYCCGWRECVAGFCGDYVFAVGFYVWAGDPGWGVSVDGLGELEEEGWEEDTT